MKHNFLTSLLVGASAFAFSNCAMTKNASTQTPEQRTEDSLNAACLLNRFEEKYPNAALLHFYRGGKYSFATKESLDKKDLVKKEDQDKTKPVFIQFAANMKDSSLLSIEIQTIMGQKAYLVTPIGNYKDQSPYGQAVFKQAAKYAHK